MQEKVKELFKLLLNTVDEPEGQFRQVIEESSEVIQSICKISRYPKDPTNLQKLIEEMGDLMNSIESVLVFLDIDKNEFDNNRYTKLHNYITNINNVKESTKNIATGIQKPKSKDSKIKNKQTKELPKVTQLTPVILGKLIQPHLKYHKIVDRVDFQDSYSCVPMFWRRMVLECNNPINDLISYIQYLDGDSSMLYIDTISYNKKSIDKFTITVFIY